MMKTASERLSAFTTGASELNAPGTRLFSDSALAEAFEAPVREVMHEPLRIPVDMQVAYALRVCEQNRVHQLLVEDSHGRVVAVVTDRDLYRGASMGAPSVESHRSVGLRVNEIASFALVTVGEWLPLFEAVQLMNMKNISCLPVVDRRGEVVELIDERSVLFHLNTVAAQAPPDLVARSVSLLAPALGEQLARRKVAGACTLAGIDPHSLRSRDLVAQRYSSARLSALAGNVGRALNSAAITAGW